MRAWHKGMFSGIILGINPKIMSPEEQAYPFEEEDKPETSAPEPETPKPKTPRATKVPPRPEPTPETAPWWSPLNE